MTTATVADITELVTTFYNGLTPEMRTGEADATPATRDEKNAVYALLVGVDDNLARSLADQCRAKKFLTGKQWYHAIRFAGEAIGLSDKVQLDFAAMIALFDAASAHLKFPKVRLVTTDGQEVCIARLGKRSNYAGSLNITDGKKFAEARWFGRIDKQGRFDRKRFCTDPVAELLVAFSADPAGVAAAYGKLTGNCCFCRKQLTDPRSTTVGYGPICAGHYQLPWGT